MFRYLGSQELCRSEVQHKPGFTRPRTASEGSKRERPPLKGERRGPQMILLPPDLEPPVHWNVKTDPQKEEG